MPLITFFLPFHMKINDILIVTGDLESVTCTQIFKNGVVCVHCMRRSYMDQDDIPHIMI